MSHPSANDITQGPLPKISHGRGVYLWDTAGRRYIDASGGPAVFSIGHGDPRVNAAVAAQMERVARATGLAGMVFTTSGSEAVESAVKIALQCHFDKRDPARVNFIARQRSWHGNTLMATALSGFAERQHAFAGALPQVGRVSAANAYRLPAGVAPDGLVAHLAAELEAEIQRLGPETVAGFIFEPVVGAAGGAQRHKTSYVLCHQPKSFDWRARGARPHPKGRLADDLFAQACVVLNQIVTLAP